LSYTGAGYVPTLTPILRRRIYPRYPRWKPPLTYFTGGRYDIRGVTYCSEQTLEEPCRSHQVARINPPPLQ
jgi:hypothetical protein